VARKVLKTTPERRSNRRLQPDRFVCEIVGILAQSDTARSRRPITDRWAAPISTVPSLGRFTSWHSRTIL
jgi:hypothetical protein